ncbi:hypothetical protein GC197_06960 [bacterium]|nr:hypothetical protein [bacterium]
MLREEINPFESPQHQGAMFQQPDEEADRVRFQVTQNVTVSPVDPPISISRGLFWARYRIPIALACILGGVMLVVITVIEANQPRFDFSTYFLIVVLCLPILLFSVSDMVASPDLDRPLARWLRPAEKRCRAQTSTWIAAPSFMLLETIPAAEFRPTIKTIVDAGYLGISDDCLFLETTEESIEIPIESIAGCDLEVPQGFLANFKHGSGLIHLIVQFEDDCKNFYLRPGYTRWLAWSLRYQVHASISLHGQILELCRKRNRLRPSEDAVVTATISNESVE